MDVNISSGKFIKHNVFQGDIIEMRERVIHSAREQIQKYGFRKFTIDDIAADLGISTKTIYKYFQSKNEIIGAVCAAAREADKRQCLDILTSEGTWLDKTMALARKDAGKSEHLHLNQELKKFFPDEWNKNCGLFDSISEQIKDFIRQGAASGDIRPDINLDVVDIIVRSSIIGLFDAEFDDLSSKQIIDELEKVVMCGILSPTSKIRGEIAK
ncbi:MAG: TetR/AcrR family transcriptional regulator [Thermacetogeniaceae bacterium]